MFKPDYFLGVVFGITTFIIMSVALPFILFQIKKFKASKQSEEINKEPINIGCGGIIIVSLVFAILVGGLFAYKSADYCKEGDYSAYECEICENPSVCIVHKFGGYDYYYCKKHLDDAKYRFDPNNYKDPSESKYSNDTKHDGEKQCKVCKKYFKMGTDNSWSIEKTGMCKQCYENYKYANDLKDDMTK